MTLATVPGYDPEGLEPSGGHAVVVGASVAGLLAARVLADGFEEVTVLDRDSLDDEPTPRPGVPQARQPHVLWEAGRATLEDLFPGYSEELVAAGGVEIDVRRDLVQYSQGDFLARCTERFPQYLATRPLYEQLIRRRVAALEAVRLRPECRFTDYVTDDAGATVEGVAVRDRAAGRDELAADLVVDATGRTSRTPAWLADRGYEPPPVDEVRIDVGYASTFVERPAGDRRTVVAPAEAPRTRGGLVTPVEGGRWLVNVHGVHGDHPPTDPEAFADFAASLAVPQPKRVLDDHPRVGDVESYPFPSNRRNRYEDLRRFPAGLVVVGDAIASFNPIYGQGMSVAALEALLLHRALATGGREELPLRFFDGAADVVDVAWTMAVGADFGFPETQGPKPRGTAFSSWYLGRLLRGAHADGALTDAFVRVLAMQEPPSSLLRPNVAWRVLKPV
ncbi:MULTISPECIES: FAD-dependent oxidoreductase [Halorussus]|uniref:FAD-dependent oxidoreductase n=1 Tax=Halorussus TaxID=1070314 RepID=UPI00209E2667|nr:FAD-dependent monooxygenase [Halorussus vallis]USZ76771.1 FAD-dependent monooxygenase [Halorussus vallis]